MRVRDFLRGQPCLEELDGYLSGLRWLVENFPEHAAHATIDADVIGPIERYRAEVMKGKVVPFPNNSWREWEYIPKKPPKKKRFRPQLERTEGEVIE